MKLQTSSETVTIDLPELMEALQPAAHVPYAPPHVFPMSVPKFSLAPQATRPSLTGLSGLYIHIPFCRYACNFCFYVKQIGADRAKMEQYVEALKKELEYIPKETLLNQLFIGGGTPTALPPDLLDNLLEAIFARTNRCSESVHTIECSPETITDEHLAVLEKHNIQRISMGVQTFHDEILDKTHRLHSGKVALEACKKLVASKHMVNIDLIYGLPGQTQEVFRKDFETLAKLGVNCINAYSLRVNESTPVLQVLHDKERLELSQLLSWRAFVEVTAKECGYQQRHWQRFMLPNTDFELNLTSDNLLGCGVSARSFLNNVVYRNHSKPKDYVQRMQNNLSPVEEVFELDIEHQKTYFVTRTLGAGKTLDYEAYQKKFGSSFVEDYGNVCKILKKSGLVTEQNFNLAMTTVGKLVYDLVTLAFYPPSLQQWLEQEYGKAIARRPPIGYANT